MIRENEWFEEGAAPVAAPSGPAPDLRTAGEILSDVGLAPDDLSEGLPTSVLTFTVTLTIKGDPEAMEHCFRTYVTDPYCPFLADYHPNGENVRESGWPGPFVTGVIVERTVQRTSAEIVKGVVDL